ncbi:hypothetical protein N0V90_003917 [Kalmusia sp. IMI 367209]|nr:hypothetical protein N0V90_003917 [Kalmusia sp. IMI 367209]
MHIFPSLALLVLAPLALARPNLSPAFQVSNLYTFEPSGRDNVSVYRISFNVTDPSDAASTSCEATWPYSERDTGYPQTWLAGCADKGWAFKVQKYEEVWDFVLDVRHVREEDEEVCQGDGG